MVTESTCSVSFLNNLVVPAHIEDFPVTIEEIPNLPDEGNDLELVGFFSDENSSEEQNIKTIIDNDDDEKM